MPTLNAATESTPVLQRMIDLAATGICMTDASGNFTRVNTAFCRTFGYESGELLGRNFSLLVPNEDLETIRSALNAAAEPASGENRTEWSAIRRDGSVLQIEVWFATDYPGEVVGTVNDITVRHASEAQLKRSLRELKALAHLRDGLEIATVEEEILRVAVRAMQDAFQTTRAAVRIDDPSETLGWRFSESVGVSAEYFEKVAALPPYERIAIESPHAFVASSLALDRPQFGAALAAEGIELAIVTPVSASGRRLGRLSAYFDHLFVVESAHLELAQIISQQAGYAMERLRAEKARVESEELLSLTFDSASIGMAVTDESGMIIQVNEALCGMFGYRSDQMVGEHFSMVMLEEDREYATAFHSQYTAGLGGVVPPEIDAQRADGTRFVADLSVAQFKRNGRPYSVSTLTDLTARHEAQELAERLGSILTNSPVEISIFNATTLRFMQMNEAALEQLDYSIDEVRELRRVDVAMDPSDGPFQELTEPLWKSESDQVHFEGLHRRKDGTTYPVETRLILSRAGGVPVFLSISEDVTERKRMADAISERDVFLRTILAGAPIILFALDAHGNYTHTSGAGLAKLNSRPGETVGSNAFALFSHHKVVLDALARVLAGTHTVVEHEIGGFHWETRLTPVIHEHTGEIEGAVGVSTDISDRRRAEQSLLQAQKLESLGVLAGGVAHDFNNLLVGILGNAGLALSELPADSPVRGSVADIAVAGHRAADLARQMLAYSGRGHFVVEPIGLNAVVTEMGRLLTSSISKSVEIVCELEDGLPLVSADATQIRQVLMNLITNGADAIEGSGRVFVTTSSIFATHELIAATYLNSNLPDGRYVQLQVTDEGSGMNEETLMRIFDPFFTTKFTGRGLGLAAVLGIVRGHGGALKVSSEVGHGTTFTLLLPVAEATTSSLTVESPAPSCATTTGTILVADDEPTVLAVTTRMLKSFGFTVVAAVDGQDALEKFERNPDGFRCALLDLTMPRLGGKEARAAILRIDPSLPVILMSGFSEQEVSAEGETGNFGGFVQKPFDLATLRETLASAMLHRSPDPRSAPAH